MVIPVRDRPAALDRCLAALGDSYPVIVVDDGSRDPAAVARVCPAATPGCAAPVVRRHRAGSRRRLTLVTTSLVAFIDSDSRPTRDGPQLAAHFADPLVGAVARGCAG